MKNIKIINSFCFLGQFLNAHLAGIKINQLESFHDELTSIIDSNFHHNGWFTKANVKMALGQIASLLDEKELISFSNQIVSTNQKKVAVIMAGNIPAVGFHDFLCVLLANHKIIIKNASTDNLLIPFFAKLIIHFDSDFADKIEFSNGKISGMQAVIATGNNNSSKYFQFYFAKYPNIIRKNRNSIAILTGNETSIELGSLGKDIFNYYGLGCRNVSKLYVPINYNFAKLFDAFYQFKEVAENKKYFNNYEYYRAIFLLDQLKFLDNNFIIVKEDKALSSPVSVLYFEFYENLESLAEIVRPIKDQIQCIVGQKITQLANVEFGKTQTPGLTDFADNVNTLEFLNGLS